MGNKIKVLTLLIFLQFASIYAGVTGKMAINNRTDDQVSLPTGSAFLVTVSDADEDKDSTQVDRVEIILAISGSKSEIRVELLETGISTGIFEQKILLGSSTPGNRGFVLDAYQNDTIEITYIDQENEDGLVQEITRTTNVTGSVLLTDASGTEQLNFTSGSTIYVQVTDGDRNADENTQETITATVVSETDTDGETVTLTETGVSTGIFLGSVSNGLSVTNGDLLTVTYVDPTDDFGNEVTLTDDAYYNVTLLSGEFTESQTWTAASSPYLVTGDVDLLGDADLTIEPGVEVRFIPLYDDRSSGYDPNRSEIRITDGNIV